MSLYIGLMSGTSLDGVDGVLVDGDSALTLRAYARRDFAAALRAELLSLNAAGDNEMHRMALGGNAVARLYAEVVADLLRMTGSTPRQVRAIGAHGQTVRHRPAEFDATGYTVQLLNGALLAELAGIDVVCDLRSRDLAAGGQGAPLVPAFHASCFAQASQDMGVLNLGGIANLTLLPAGGPVRGFDCGPASVLMDLWVQRHRGLAFDDAGSWAAGGTVNRELLASMRAEPYFSRPLPKSTGRDLFHAAWLDRHLARQPAAIDARDVQASLLELTAVTVWDALVQHAPRTAELVVCGGGAFNAALMARLQQLAAPARVRRSDELGVAPDHVEAIAFAWLARAFFERRPGNLAAVTGARGPRVLGALYPA